MPPSRPYLKNWNIWENRGTTRSRHKTANCADNITLLATWGRGVRIATRGSHNMNDLYLSCAALALPGQRPRARRRPWTAACLLSLMVAAGAGRANAAPLDEAAERYRPHVVEGIGQALAGARDLRGRIAASDLAGARKAWIAARAGWERSEVFTAGFVPELDAQIDAWPNAQSGFHAIEAKLFGTNQIDVEGETDALVDHLSSLHGKLHDIDLAPQGFAGWHGEARLRGR